MNKIILLLAIYSVTVFADSNGIDQEWFFARFGAATAYYEEQITLNALSEKEIKLFFKDIVAYSHTDPLYNTIVLNLYRSVKKLPATSAKFKMLCEGEVRNIAGSTLIEPTVLKDSCTRKDSKKTK